MKKIPLVFIFSFSIVLLSGQVQTISHQTISSGGGMTTEAGTFKYITFTVGGEIAGTIGQNDVFLTQGFQQLFSILVGVVETKVKGKIQVFPNPSSGNFSLEFEAPVTGKWHYSLFSSEGRLLFMESMGEGNTFYQSIDAGQLSPGNYLLVVYNQKMEISEVLRIQIVR